MIYGKLINRGIFSINSDGNSKIFVIVGVARGGTSVVAGVLDKLGVYMGDGAVAPVFEDTPLSQAFESKKRGVAAEIAARYSANHDHWAWKRPSCINYLPEVHRALGAPNYIFIYRDLLSIAQRNAISMQSDVMASMAVAHKQYSKAHEFLSKNRVRALLLSYEKVMLYPDHFLDQLLAFCGLAPSTQALEAARRFMTHNSPDYLDATRITKAEGVIEQVTAAGVSGWARFVHTHKAPDIELFVNDNPVAKVKAHGQVPGHEGAAVRHAFRFELSGLLSLRSGDVVRGRVDGEVVDLQNSPFLVQ